MKRIVFSGRHLKIEEETFKFRGVTKTQLIERKSDVAHIVPRLPNGKLLMERHYRSRIKKYLLEFPAGYINGNERPGHAAVRELEEETGYVPGEIKPLVTVYGSAGWGAQKWHFFYATDLRKGRAGLDPKEILTVKEIRADELSRMVANGKIVDSATVLAFLFYSSYIRNRPKS